MIRGRSSTKYCWSNWSKKSSSSAGRFQFSLERQYSVICSIPSRAHSSVTQRTLVAPRRCPSMRGRPRCRAQRPLPSMMMAICRGKRSRGTSDRSVGRPVEVDTSGERGERREARREGRRSLCNAEHRNAIAGRVASARDDNRLCWNQSHIGRSGWCVSPFETLLPLLSFLLHHSRIVCWRSGPTETTSTGRRNISPIRSRYFLALVGRSASRRTSLISFCQPGSVS